MAKASTRVPLTLCCAQEDASHIRPVLTLLEREEGYRVRLIEGVEEDPYLLGSSLDRQLGACVIIACLSDALGPAQFRRIEGVYNARKGPDHYLDTIFVEPDETLAMAESVRGVVAKANAKLIDKPKPKPKPRPSSASSSASHLRDVVGVTNLSAVGTDARRAGPAIVDPSESSLGLGKPAPITASEDAAPASSAASTTSGAASASTAGESVSSTPAGEFSPASSMSAASSQLLYADERKNPAWVAPVLFLIFLAVAGTVVLLLLQQQETTEWLVRRGAPQLGAESINEEAEAEAKADAKKADAAKAGADEADTAKAAPEPVDSTGAEAGEPEQDSGEPEEGGTAAEESSGEPDSASDDEVEEALIIEAIENGEMRAVDLILIAKTSELTPWRDAANRCRSKSVNGVRGWRLPTLNELKTIRKARMVERNYRYWSSTLATKVGTGHSHVYVLDLSKGTIDPLSKEAADVRVLCVRPALDRKKKGD